MHPYKQFVADTSDRIDRIMQSFGFQGLIAAGDMRGEFCDFQWSTIIDPRRISEIDAARLDFLLQHIGVQKIVYDAQTDTATLTVLYRQ